MANHNQPMQAQFFVTREDDKMVPLVPLDELPDHVVIEDLPRALKPSMIVGMTCVGAFKARQHQYSVTFYDPTQQLRSMPEASLTPPYHSDEEVCHGVTPRESRFVRTPDGRASNSSSTATQQHPDLDAMNIEATPSSRGVDMTSHRLPENPQLSTSLPSSGNTGVKEYCSFWLRRGECDYAQQGCLYRHEMPQDLATLHRLGLRDIPAWYRQRHGLKSLLTVPGAGGRLPPFRRNLRRTLNDDRQQKQDRSQTKTPLRRNTTAKSSPARWRAMARRNYARLANKMNDTGMCTPTDDKEISETTAVDTQAVQQQNAVPQLEQDNFDSVIDTGMHSPAPTAMSEVYSDIEMEYVREDAARKAQEDAEYALLVQKDHEGKEAATSNELQPDVSGSGHDNDNDQHHGHANPGTTPEQLAEPAPPQFPIDPVAAAAAAAVVPFGRFRKPSNGRHGSSSSPPRTRHGQRQHQTARNQKGGRPNRYQKSNNAKFNRQGTDNSGSNINGNGNGNGNGNDNVNQYLQRSHKRTQKCKKPGPKGAQPNSQT